MSSYFEGSTLFISARSPFARRVRIAFLENGIAFEERVLDVFQPQPDLWKANPLARVPALRARDGGILIDSSLILQALYEEMQSPFMPKDPDGRRAVYRWQAIGLGLAEKTVEYYLETLRQEPAQDQELFGEIRDVVSRTLERVESCLGETGAYLVPNDGRPTQADFDIGAALAYLRLRYPMFSRPEFQSRFPRAVALLRVLDERPSFVKTEPPGITA